MDKLSVGGMQERLFLTMPPKETKLKIENCLAEVSCNLNVLQWQFILALMAAMMPVENKMNFFMLSTKEIAQLLNVMRNRKRIIWHMIDDLWEQEIYVGNDHRLRWFYELCPLELEGDVKDYDYICFRMHEGLAKYLMSYEKGYVLLCLDELLKFTCKYSFQLYALFIKNKKFKKKKMRVSDLATQLGVPNSYKRTITHLIQKAIEPAISEINRITALNIKYELTTDFQSIYFRIQQKEINIADSFFDSLNPEAQIAYTYFKDNLKVSKSAIIHCVNTHGEDVFIKIYLQFRNKPNNGIKNMAAYAATCLRNGYFTEEPELPKRIKRQDVPVPPKDNYPTEDEAIKEQQKAEELKAQEERKKQLDELNSLLEDEQKQLYKCVLDFAKEKAAIKHMMLKQHNYESIKENQFIFAMYLGLINEMKGGETDGEKG